MRCNSSANPTSQLCCRRAYRSVSTLLMCFFAGNGIALGVWWCGCSSNKSSNQEDCGPPCTGTRLGFFTTHCFGTCSTNPTGIDGMTLRCASPWRLIAMSSFQATIHLTQIAGASNGGGCPLAVRGLGQAFRWFGLVLKLRFSIS